ncbi:MAG: TusE/DsrC/DsvC family sulfur relay protein [Desulfobulbus sp.]
MKTFTYKDVDYALDDQGCLLDSDDWNEDFAEGMARECDVPVLSSEHWDVIRYVRDLYSKTGVCPTIFAACRANGLRLQEMQKLFPSGHHRGLCRIAGVQYRLQPKAYGRHLKENMAAFRAMAKGDDKVYGTDARGFLVDADTWDENFAVHRALEMHIPNGVLSEEHWRIIYYLRDVFQVEHRIPTIYETCESCDMDLDSLEQLFPDGYHRGALKIAGLRYLK